MAVIRSIRGGTAGLNEEERLTIARLLIKAGYSVKIGYRVIPGNTKGKKEYIVEYWEKGEEQMLTEMSLKEALKYFMKGRKVLVLNEYDDKSISAERIEDCLPKEAKYLVDVPAVPNPEFEQAVQDMVEPDQNENDAEGDEQLPPRPTGEETGKRNGSSSGEDEQGRKK